MDIVPGKLAIAEDCESLREGYVGFARNTGYDQIDAFHDGSPLVEAARLSSYDLIITDYELPELNGLKALEEIRTFDKKTPIYVISAVHVRGTLNVEEEAAKFSAKYLCKSTKNFWGKVTKILMAHLPERMPQQRKQPEIR